MLVPRFATTLMPAQPAGGLQPRLARGASEWRSSFLTAPELRSRSTASRTCGFSQYAGAANFPAERGQLHVPAEDVRSGIRKGLARNDVAEQRMAV